MGECHKTKSLTKCSKIVFNFCYFKMLLKDNIQRMSEKCLAEENPPPNRRHYTNNGLRECTVLSIRIYTV